MLKGGGMKRIWVIFLCLFFMVSGVQGEGDFCEGSVLKKYCEGIIGNWCIGDSLYIVTSEYVLYIPGKRMKCSYSKEVKGTLFMYEVMPSKTFYAISKEGGIYLGRCGGIALKAKEKIWFWTIGSSFLGLVR